MNYGNTILNSSQPWGLYRAAGSRVLCADGKIRSLAYIGHVADTYFSIPAAIRVRGKYIRGYVTAEEQHWIKDVKETGFRRAYVFRALTGQPFPAWPGDIACEHNALIDLAYPSNP